MIGTVDSLWHYPVKSMRGEELAEVFIGFGGVQGDRRFAFHSSAAPLDFPFFTARQQTQMLRYRPRVDPDNGSIEVETPSGKTLAIDDPALIDELRSGADPKHKVTLVRFNRSQADGHAVSLMSVQTVQQLADEAGLPPEKRRYRESIYLDLPNTNGFGEDEFVGRSLRIGKDVVVAVVERDQRCMMTNLDPDSAEASPAMLKTIAQKHGGNAGVYCEVLREGIVRKGDSVELLRHE